MKQLKDLDISKKKIAIFDLDGTLIDSAGLWSTVDAHVVYELTGTKVSSEMVFGFYLKSANNHAYHEWLQKTLIPAHSIDDIKAKRTEIVSEFYRKVDYKPHADTVLKLLKKKGFVLSMATNCPPEHFQVLAQENEFINEKAPIKATFDSIWLPDDKELLHAPELFETKKPDEEIFSKILKYHGFDASEGVAIEDNVTGIEAAFKAGLTVISLEDKYSANRQAEIDKMSHCKIRGFDEMVKYLESGTTRSGLEIDNCYQK